MAKDTDNKGSVSKASTLHKDVQAATRATIAEIAYLKELTKEYEKATDAKREYFNEKSGNRVVALFVGMKNKIKDTAKEFRDLSRNFEKLSKTAAEQKKQVVMAQLKYNDLLASMNKLSMASAKGDKIQEATLKKVTKELGAQGKILQKTEKSHQTSEKKLKSHLSAVTKYKNILGMVKAGVLGVAVAFSGILIDAASAFFNVLKKGYDAWKEFYWRWQLDMVHTVQSLRDQIGPSGAMIKGMKKMAGMTFWKGWGMEEAANVAAKLAENLDISQMTASGAKDWIKVGILASKGLGMGAEAAGDFVGRLHKGWQLTNKDITEYILRIKDAASETGATSVLMAKDISENMDVWTKYGKNFMTMAISSSRMARQYGVSLKELLSVSDKFSTFESSAESVGKLNAVMGLNLNTAKMLMATETERADILREEMMKSGKNWQNLSRFEREAVINMTGWNAETAQAVLSTGKQQKSLGQLQKEEEKRARQKKNDSRLQREANKLLSDMAHVLDEYFGPNGKLKRMWEQMGKVFEPFRKVIDDFKMNTLDKLITRFKEWQDNENLQKWADKLKKILDKLGPPMDRVLNWLDTMDENGSTGMDKILEGVDNLAYGLLKAYEYSNMFYEGLVGIAYLYAKFQRMSSFGAEKEAWAKTEEELGKSYKKAAKGTFGAHHMAETWKDQDEQQQIQLVQNNKLKPTDFELQLLKEGKINLDPQMYDLSGIDTRTKTGKITSDKALEQSEQKSKKANKKQESMAKDAASTQKKIDNIAGGINNKKGIQTMGDYYDTSYKVMKKIASFEDSILDKAAAKMKKVDQAISSVDKAAMISALDTIQSKGNVEANNAKIGDIQILVADIQMDGNKVGQAVFAATRKG